MYKKFEKLLQARGCSSYRVAKDLGFATTVFQIGSLVKVNPR